MIRFALVASVGILLLIQQIRSQPLFFSNYTLEKGLSQSVVNCLYQDSKGYIWAGTQNGLNRFDGYGFRVYSYNPADTTTLSNNWIYAITEDREGNLWIGTKGGLNKWVRKENRFRRIRYTTPYGNQVTNYPYDVKTASDGSILINTPPVLSILDPARGTFRHVISKLAYDGSVKDNRIPLAEDRNGCIWTGSTRGLACFDRKSNQFRYFFTSTTDPYTISDNYITALWTDREGVVWIGTTRGLNRYDPVSGKFRRFLRDPADRQSLGSDYIRAITGDSLGWIWIGTEGGGLSQCRWSAATEGNNPYNESGLRIINTFTAEKNGLNHNIILDLTIDRTRNLWIGTLQGLTKTDLKRRKFHLYRKDDTPTSVNLTGNVIASIYKDEKGLVWVGTWGQGLNVINRKTGEVVHFSTQETGSRHLTNDFVHVIFCDLWGNIWIGTRDGIHVYDREQGSFIRFRRFFRNPALPDFLGMRINMILRGRDNSFWVATQEGLYRITLDPVSTEIFRAEAYGHHTLSANLIYSLLEDRDGRIWIATLNGLDVYDPRRQEIRHYQKSDSANSLADNFIISLGEDYHGDVWVGTGSYVNRFVKNSGTFRYYGPEQGLPGNNVFEIVEDHRKNLWFATGNGLCRFDSLTGRFRTYTVEEGLQGLEFNLRARYLSPDGELFFGGMNGFNSFYPDSLTDNPFLPEIVFTSFSKTNREGTTFIDADNLREVNLKAGDQTFTVEFSALEFTNPAKNQYAYLLEGISDNWIETGNRRFVPFSNLPPGEYVLRVKGSNNDGVWNEKGLSLKIIIHPPWWRSSYALVAYAIIIAGLILIFIRIRERNLRRERDLLEEKVHQRTLQIEEQKNQILQKNDELSKLNDQLSALNTTRDRFFSIIAHDLRNPFNTILGLSEIALGEDPEKEPAKYRRTLSDIRETAKHTFDLLQNLLIWARSQTGALDFEPAEFDLMERIQENIGLVRSQAGKKGITISFIDGSTHTVKADIRMIDTILRNLLTNAIKFTPQQGEIKVILAKKDGMTEIRVCDTGIGINPSDQDRIFMPENRFVRKGTEKERGTGLGLILCREFAQKHGGTIRVESEPGKGSTFIVSLPEKESIPGGS